MISKDTRITALDLNDGEPFYGTIDELFIKYADIAYPAYLGQAISFKNVKIQDWTGWTELTKIQKTNSPEEFCWYKVGASEDIQGDSNIYQITFPYIKMTHYQEILLYNDNDIQRGFHGEVKYRYSVLCPIFEDLSGKLRIRQPSFKSSDTWNMYVEELKRFAANIDLSNIIDKDIDDWKEFHDATVEMTESEDYGYTLITKSGFYNANGIHMFCGNLSTPVIPNSGYK